MGEVTKSVAKTKKTIKWTISTDGCPPSRAVGGSPQDQEVKMRIVDLDPAQDQG